MVKTKRIIGYENFYIIGEDGNVLALPRKRIDGRFYEGKFLKFKPIKNTGYLQVRLYKDGVHKSYSLHRLVAMHFIPNPTNLPEINHKDGNRTNNKVSNLEWCNRSYNIKDGYNRGRIVWNKGKKLLSTKTCPYCNKTFSPKKSKRIFCSKKCSNTFRNKGLYLKSNNLLEGGK